MSKRKSSEGKEIEVRTGIYITFFNKICLYVRIINSKIPKIYKKTEKKSKELRTNWYCKKEKRYRH